MSKTLLLVCLITACGNPVPAELQAAADGEPGAGREGRTAAGAANAKGVAVKPPFAVAGELEGLLLVWLDADGVHTASSRADIPSERRGLVRVDSLALPPDKRLDPDQVYVADVSAVGADGSYPVKRYPRTWFEAQIEALAPAPAEATSGVTLYMASWCGACRSAAAYMRSRGVAFVEKDIEKDAAAASEMRAKAKAAGKTPRGVPVIDFDGTLLMGFDKGALAALIDARKPG